MYKFILKTSNYDDHYYVETNTFNRVELSSLEKTPMQLKLFSNDVFDYDEETKQVSIKHSNYRSNKYNSGILDLTMTHGKTKSKFLYLCKPDDKRIPFFLIPYNVPYNFNKCIKKLYITFEFDHWNENNKFPHGKITQNLGNIDELVNFYEYILYCKSLNISIQPFTKEIKKKLTNQSNEEIIENISKKHKLKIIGKKDEFVFTIDSSSSNDYDDAISYNFKEHKISIYITNVALVIDYLNIWDSFTNRISSIYLPDKKRSMLPNILSECLCSLKEKNNKLCYCLDIYYDDNNEIIKQELNACQVYISKNFHYQDEQSYMNNKYYKKISEILNAKNSKDVVTILMLHFNHYIAKKMSQYDKGIYKSLSQEKIKEKITNIPKDVLDKINIIRNQSSSYCLYNEQEYHSVMHQNIDIYLQATSPIRRLVDILNNICIIDCFTSIQLSDQTKRFYQHWTSPEKLDYINTSFRAIRKIQSKCQIYDKHEQNKKENKDVFYEGYIYDKILKEGDGKFQYMVYLPEISLASYITMVNEFDNYSKHSFKLYVFLSEENDKKKIKLQIIHDSIF